MKIWLYRLCVALLTGIVASVVMMTGMFGATSNSLSDALYQQNGTPDSRIVIIGIDELALERLGNYPWDRDITAQAIATLNADENSRPAVIGLDMLFPTPSDNDDMLLQVSEQYDNLVFASYAEFGTELTAGVGNDFYVDDYAVLNYFPPFEQLANTSAVGQVNAMLDGDGVLRHAIWQIDVDGEVVSSFNGVIAQMYAEQNDMPNIEKPPTDARHRWYVVQQSQPGAYYDSVSVADIIDGTVNSSYFADKIVLIGPYAPGLQDDYQTPISSSEKMFGVEYQANAISALLTGTTKTHVPQVLQTIIVAVIVMLSSLFLYKRRFVYALIYFLALSAVWVLTCVLLFDFGYIMHVFYLPLFLGVMFIGFTGVNYSLALIEKRRISSTFKRYVAPQIVNELLKGDKEALQLGGRVVEVAVLFADIRGFTPLAEKLPPQTVVEIINKYLSVFSDCVFRNDGTLDKYIGDCTMAFWGAPLPQTDSALKAVKTGAEIVKRSNELSRQIKDKYGHIIDVGVGITYGPAVVGNIGCSQRMDYTLIGDTVNTAARLEQAAPGGELYVDKKTTLQLQDKAGFELIEGITLKGKEDGFEVFRFVYLN